MPEYVVGLRSKDGDIHIIRVKAQSVSPIGQGQDYFWKVVGETPGNEIVIHRDAFVFAGPEEIITDLG